MKTFLHTGFYWLVCMLVLAGCAKNDDKPMAALDGERWNNKEILEIEQYIQSRNLFVEKDRSGLYYKIIELGDTTRIIKPDNIPSLIYTRRLLGDKLVDASFGATDFDRRPLKDHIPGWQIGLQKIGKGGKILLIIPSYLAFGNVGLEGIPPNSPLVCELELVDFN